MFQSNSTDKNMSSILGPELEIKGDVKVEGSLLIYGKVFGNIESKGSIRTSKGSFVEGNITAREASISGEVIGDLNIESKVNLGKTSILKGNLKASILTIEEGATFEGICNMHQKAQKLKSIKSQ
tara:strand:- start:371 stop:745 length:375 start_codon:yes stop_codon:yes gene_type:complete